MAEENVSDVKQMFPEVNDFDAKATVPSEEGCEEIISLVGKESVLDVPPPMFDGQRDIPEIHEVTVPKAVNLRRHSIGVIGMQPGKARVQPRYLGNHVSSTHDICKHGKRCEDDVVKPWKLARRKSVIGENAGKTEALSAIRTSLGGGVGQISGSKHRKPNNCSPAKREPVVVGERCAYVKPDSSGPKEANHVVRPADGSSVKRSGQTGKNKETENSPSDSAVVRKATGLKTEKTKNAVRKVSSVSSAKSSKDGGQKTKTEPVSSEDIPEKTLYVVESSVEKRCDKVAKGEIQRASRKKMTRTTKNSVKSPKDMPSLSPSSVEKDSRTTKSDSRPTGLSSRAKTSSISPSLYKRKVSVSANLAADAKSESKNKPKKIAIKVTPLPRQLNFKRGKVLEPKSGDSTPTWLKFRRRVSPESSKIKSDGRKKSLKDRRDSGGKSNSPDVKPEKVVLRHRNVEAKKKSETLFNNVIEETASKLEEVRKSKVKALVGAFETVISLQDNKSPPKLQTRATTAAPAKG